FQPVWKTINHLALDNNFDPSPYLNRYKNAVYYDDMQVGRVLQTLRDKNLMDNTIIILTADHGEEFNDTHLNYWGHNSNFTRYQTQVPMVIYWPGKQKAEIAYATSSLDLAPTLLQHALGCKNPETDYTNGKDLFNSEPRKFFLSSGWDRFALITDKQIDVIFDAGNVENYDSNYASIAQGIDDLTIISSAMNGMSRYYKK
ncbi:MAG: sulfatase-like hydrolase/transferase, partial [Gammaproteobacteria bacterium]|nr:sulfatase-like hydrolase/transferase [Gammaproteobacteria bacterium]